MRDHHTTPGQIRNMLSSAENEQSKSLENLRKTLPAAPVWCGEAKRPEGAHRGTVPSSEKIAAPSLPGGVEGHVITGDELTDSHEAIKSGAGRGPYSSVQRGRDVKG